MKSPPPNITTLQHQLHQLEAKWKRAVADYQNLERRVNQGQQEFVKFATASLIDKLLPLLDDLQRAYHHHQDHGLKLILDQFQAILKSEGVAEVTVQGQKFNPATMDCADMVTGPKDTVVKVLTKGYTLNGKVLRPAKVEVGKGESA